MRWPWWRRRGLSRLQWLDRPRPMGQGLGVGFPDRKTVRLPAYRRRWTDLLR